MQLAIDLYNSISIKEELHNKLILKGYHFLKNYKIENYKFDFFCVELKIAIEIDGYAHEYTDVYNQDTTKKLHIQSLGITVFRFTDHQILVDIEEIFRALTHHIKITAS